MTEIQGKSILVRVSARFESARVRVIGSRLYFTIAGVKKIVRYTEDIEVRCIQVPLYFLEEKIYTVYWEWRMNELFHILHTIQYTARIGYPIPIILRINWPIRSMTRVYLMPSAKEIHLTKTLKMTTAQVVTVKNSPIQAGRSYSIYLWNDSWVQGIKKCTLFECQCI